jgi:hypothetical protein
MIEAKFLATAPAAEEAFLSLKLNHLEHAQVVRLQQTSTMISRTQVEISSLDCLRKRILMP